MHVPSMIRTRWAAVGAALAVSLGAGGVSLIHATGPNGASAFVPVTACRLVDTRPQYQKGPRATPLGEGETYTLSATGAQADCNIPVGATGVVTNVTAVNATQPTYLTVWAAGAAQPTASALNPAPGQPPTPNAVTTNLDGAGQFSIFNLAGTVDVIVDVVGYYTDHQHDDRYYTKQQVDAALAVKASAAGTLRAGQTNAALVRSSFQYVSAQQAFSGAGAVTVAAVCPPGKVAVSGGYKRDSGAVKHPVSSGPAADHRSWAVTFAADIGGFTATTTATVYAMCVTLAVDYTVARTDLQANSFSNYSQLDATCPPGTHVLGGGPVFVSGSVPWLVDGAGPLPDASGWRVSWNTDNAAAAGPGSAIAVQAVCADVDVSQASSAPGSIAIGTTNATTSLSCPNGGVAVAGGATATSPGSATWAVLDSYPAAAATQTQWSIGVATNSYASFATGSYVSEQASQITTTVVCV